MPLFAVNNKRRADTNNATDGHLAQACKEGGVQKSQKKPTIYTSALTEIKLVKMRDNVMLGTDNVLTLN